MYSFLESKQSDLEEQKQQHTLPDAEKNLQIQQQWCEIRLKQNCFSSSMDSIKELCKGTGQDGVHGLLLKKKKQS